jgi:ABC-type amino acid transport substrate-binding protein
MKTPLIALALVAATVCAHADTTLKRIADNNRMTLAYRESSIPFSYLDGPGKPIGFSHDISVAVADAVKKKLNKPNLEIAYLPVTSQNRIPLVQNGSIDLECGSTTNNTARGRDVDFSTNFFYSGTRLLVKKDSGVKNYKDLAGKTTATTTGTTNLQVLRKYFADNNIDTNMVYGKDHADSFLLVETGRAAAFGMDDILLYGLRANSKDPSAYEVVGDALQVEPYACMMQKGDTEFKKLVDDTINGMMKSGEFATDYTKWFEKPIPPRNISLDLPMSKELKDNLTAMSDKPAK